MRVLPCLLIIFSISRLSQAAEASPNAISPASGILQVMASGNLPLAESQLQEALKQNPRDLECAFLAAVCERSRFVPGSASPLFLKIMTDHPDSLEARASACALGLDLAFDRPSALFYYNALVILSRQNSRSIPIRWLTGMMSRTITRSHVYKKDSEQYRRIVQCGIRDHETLLTLMGPGQGPQPVHQTLANLLDSANDYDNALKHRQLSLTMSRKPGVLQGAAVTLMMLDRQAEALPLLQEGLAQEPDNTECLATLGRVLLGLGKKEEAIRTWSKLAQLQPTYIQDLLSCALASRDLGDYSAAREYTRRAVERRPGDPISRIYDARFAALLGEPGATEQMLAAGSLDYLGKPSELKKDPDPWFHAVDTGNLAAVRQLIGTVDINTSHPKYKQTPLMLAACYGWEHIAAELIRAGAKLDLQDINGDTALHYTAQFTQPRVMKLLLDAGADPNIQDKWGTPPLVMCTPEYRPDCFEMLLQSPVDIHISTPTTGSALHYAAGHGRINRIQKLLAKGARVNTPTQNRGITPLMTACLEWPHAYIVTPLIEAGADINAKDHDGRTALHHAVNPLMNAPLVHMLIEKGANPAQADKEGITPIAQARLLGFESIAKQMEAKVGKPEPFQFPKFEPPDATLTTEGKNAAYFVFPILLAQGHPLGRASGVRIGEKRAAIRELRWMFDIENSLELKQEIQELEAFDPRHRAETGTLPPDLTIEELGSRLAKQVRNIHASCTGGAVDETAWVKSHIIYLADLGVAAGYLPQAEGDALIHNASTALKSKFASWPDYNRSFLLGATYHNAWEADRYEQVCNRILDAQVPWP